MQIRKSLLIGMVIASLWAATGFVQPVWGQDGGRAGRGGMLRLLYKVGLTDDQKAQVKQILANHRTTLRSWRSQLQMNREQLSDMLLGASPLTSDDPQLQSLAQTAHDLRGKIAHEWLQAMVEVRAILRPDQLAQAAQLQDQLRTLRKEMHSLLGNEP
jgi:Spy/CpxP family protein refolding chaperone